VPASTRLAALLELRVAARGGALPLVAAGGQHAVVQLEQVRPVLADRAGLDGVIIAADVARPVPHLDADDELWQALRVMDELGVDALPVVEASDPQPSGIVTRSQIGQFLLDHYAGRPR
jgi:CBS domain-containing protein